MAGNSFQARVDKAFLSPFEKAFLLIRWIENIRGRHWSFHWVLTSILTLIVAYLGSVFYHAYRPTPQQKFNSTIELLQTAKEKTGVDYSTQLSRLQADKDAIIASSNSFLGMNISIWRLLKSVLVGFVINACIRGAMPLLFFSPNAIALRSLGVWEAHGSKRDPLNVMKKFISKNPENSRVKVICISGKHLFNEFMTPEGTQSPLWQKAKNGLLDVVMPISKPENATIAFRHKTYSDDYKVQEKITTVQAFVEQINHGKGWLRSRSENIIYEHDILCMWRVLILDEYCLVQNYFPNPHKGHSFESPLLVFKKVSDEQKLSSYYYTFTEMFNLIAKKS
jgi:hypothetical protein